jgi:electron transport complex protein RnfB
LPVGFPATKSGVEIRILKRLFTPEEAKFALQLSMLPEPIERIYRRVKERGMSLEQVKQIVGRMVDKGTIMNLKIDGEDRYSNAPFVIGMYEAQVDRMTKDFMDDASQYLDDEAFRAEFIGPKVPQMRTVPVEKSIPLPDRYMVGSYDDIRKIIENAGDKLSIANCICRQVKDAQGHS